MSGNLPYDDEYGKMIGEIKTKQRAPIERNFSSKLKNLVNRMLTIEV
jgi:hypothetical protein